MILRNYPLIMKKDYVIKRPFVGHMQTAASDQGLNCLLTQYSIQI